MQSTPLPPAIFLTACFCILLYIHPNNKDIPAVRPWRAALFYLLGSSEADVPRPRTNCQLSIVHCQLPRFT